MKKDAAERMIRFHAYEECQKDYRHATTNGLHECDMQEFCFELARASGADNIEVLNESGLLDSVVTATAHYALQKDRDDKRYIVDAMLIDIEKAIISYYKHRVRKLFAEGVEEYEEERNINPREMAGIPQRGD